MSKSRREQREAAVLLSYEMEAQKNEEINCLTEFLERQGKSQEEYEYTYIVMQNFLANYRIILKAIELGAENWKINRISKMDLAILKIAIAEMLYIDDVPTGVAINEAVEISKKYSNEKSYKFINGVLRHVSDSLSNMADEGKSYTEYLSGCVDKDIKEEELEKAREKEIELIKKRLEKIREEKALAEAEAKRHEEERRREELLKNDIDIEFLDL